MSHSENIQYSRTIRICYFPGRESSYSRTRILIKGMREAGLQVFDCSYPKKQFLRYFVGFYKFLKYRNQCDLVLVGFFGHCLVPIIKIFTSKRIFFDAFVSVYVTMVLDRKTIKSVTFLAGLTRYIDRLSCQLADKVFLDTYQNIQFFMKEYPLAENKFCRLIPGSDDSVMYPRGPKENHDFIVHFHGEYQPLHGIEYIIQAAKILPDIKFQLIGKGQKLKSCRDMVQEFGLTNVDFISSVSYERLAEHIANASICLGIFGDTIKANLVIPHKVYEALAMNKPLITSDTAAVRELLTHNENAFLCKSANPQSLANAILRLKKDPVLRAKLADNGYALFKEKCLPVNIGLKIKELAEKQILADRRPE